MTNPSSAGMGHGAAQVFDTRNVLNSFIRVSMMEQQQRQMDEQNLAKMMSQFDPSKLRPQDQREFTQKYNELQNLYMQNKGLYRNPMKHLDAYQKAQSLTNELRGLAANSKAFESFLSDGSKAILSNRNKFRGSTLSNMNRWSGMSTAEVIAENGGRLPSYTDLQYVPDEPDQRDIKTLVGAASDDLGVRRRGLSSVKTYKDDPMLDKTETLETWEDRVDQTSFGQIAKFGLNKPEWRDYYQYKYEELTPEQRIAVGTEARTKFPNIDHNDGATMLAAVEWSKQYGVLDREVKKGKNEAEARAIKKKETDDARAFQLALHNDSQNRSDARQAKGLAAMENMQNFNAVHIGEALGALESGGVATPQGRKDVAKAKKVIQYIPAQQIAEFNPAGYKTKEEFVNTVMNWQAFDKGRTQNGLPVVSDQQEESFRATKKDAENAWDKKQVILGHRATVDANDVDNATNPTKYIQKVRMLVPGKSGNKEAWTRDFNFVISDRKGPGFGTEEYTQPRKK